MHIFFKWLECAFFISISNNFTTTKSELKWLEILKYVYNIIVYMYNLFSVIWHLIGIRYITDIFKLYICFAIH